MSFEIYILLLHNEPHAIVKNLEASLKHQKCPYSGRMMVKRYTFIDMFDFVEIYFTFCYFYAIV